MTTQSPALVGRFVSTVFTELNQRKLTYALLRNYDGLPDQVGHDIDILVAEEEIDAFSTTLCQVAREQGWSLALCHERHAFRSFVFAQTFDITSEKILKWDIWAPIKWRWFTCVDSKMALQSRQLHPKGFYIISPGVEAAILLVKELLEKGQVPEKYESRIRQFAETDPKRFKEILEGPFGTKLVNSLITRVEEGDWNQIKNSYGSLRIALMKNAAKRHIFATMLDLCKFTIAHLREFMRNKKGLFICLIGPDGTGKSTISSRLIDSLSDVFGEIRYHHAHYDLLPELKTFCPWLQEKTKKVDVSTLPSESMVPGRLTTGIVMLYYAIDYVLGRARTFPRRGLGEFVIFDRYFYDYAIQPSPFGVNSWLFRLLVRLIPSPDLVIYLDAPPDMIRKRKPDLTLKEITRQASICNQIVSHMPKGHIVDNSLPLDEVINQ
ncbi:hypothetical protein ACFLVI_04445, partial [Chloroflexota bacterium]